MIKICSPYRRGNLGVLQHCWYREDLNGICWRIFDTSSYLFKYEILAPINYIYYDYFNPTFYDNKITNTFYISLKKATKTLDKSLIKLGFKLTETQEEFEKLKLLI